jgi:hypothetical protein
MLPSGARNNWVLYKVPKVPGLRSHRPITTYTPAWRAASPRASVVLLGISTEFRNRRVAKALLLGSVAGKK